MTRVRSQPHEAGPSRRTVLAGGAALLVYATLVGPAAAEDVVVPVELQMKLLAKVASYDKNLPARAGDRVKILVLSKKDDPDSKRVAEQALKALEDHKEIAGIKVATSSATFAGAAELKKAVAAQHLSIVYLGPGVDRKEVEGLASALEGVDVMTVTAVPQDVARGVVLGFDLVSGKPKILVHLGQAKKQNVALSADVLKLAKVYE